MKRIIVKGKNWHANIPVTKVVRDENIVFAYCNGEFVGMFDLGVVDCIWVSEDKT